MKKTPVKETRRPSGGLAFLIESELDKAEVVLAAQSIAKKLQDMAADLAKIEADDIMPILDNMRLTFGPEMTDSFNDITTAKVRQTMEAVKAAKEAVSKEISRMEAAVNGDMTNDMGMDDGNDLGMDGDMGADDDSMGGDDLGGELDAASDDDAAVGDVPAPDTEDAADDLDTAFDDAGDSAAGRAKKESVQRNVKALRESKNPDRLIFETFRRTLKESKGQAVRAAKAVAEAFSIDYSDVVEIVKENAVQEGKTFKDEKGKSAKNKDRAEDRKAKKRDRDRDLDESEEVDESAVGAKVLVTPKSKDKPFSKPFKIPAAKK